MNEQRANGDDDGYSMLVSVDSPLIRNVPVVRSYLARRAALANRSGIVLRWLTIAGLPIPPLFFVGLFLNRSIDRLVHPVVIYALAWSLVAVSALAYFRLTELLRRRAVDDWLAKNVSIERTGDRTFSVVILDQDEA